MFKPHHKCSVLVAAAGFLTGCFPIQYTINPGASGAVVDAQSKNPVTGASVLLATSKRRVSTTTNNHGEFMVSPDQEWGIYIVPMDPFPLEGSVTIQASGYKETTKQFRTSTIGPANSKLGEISLERSP
jgi:hypothetical protein